MVGNSFNIYNFFVLLYYNTGLLPLILYGILSFFCVNCQLCRFFLKRGENIFVMWSAKPLAKPNAAIKSRNTLYPPPTAKRHNSYQGSGIRSSGKKSLSTHSSNSMMNLKNHQNSTNNDNLMQRGGSADGGNVSDSNVDVLSDNGNDHDMDGHMNRNRHRNMMTNGMMPIHPSSYTKNAPQVSEYTYDTIFKQYKKKSKRHFNGTADNHRGGKGTHYHHPRQEQQTPDLPSTSMYAHFGSKSDRKALLLCSPPSSTVITVADDHSSHYYLNHSHNSNAVALHSKSQDYSYYNYSPTKQQRLLRRKHAAAKDKGKDKDKNATKGKDKRKDKRKRHGKRSLISIMRSKPAHAHAKNPNNAHKNGHPQNQDQKQFKPRTQTRALPRNMGQGGMDAIDMDMHLLPPEAIVGKQRALERSLQQTDDHHEHNNITNDDIVIQINDMQLFDNKKKKKQKKNRQTQSTYGYYKRKKHNYKNDNHNKYQQRMLSMESSFSSTSIQETNSEANYPYVAFVRRHRRKYNCCVRVFCCCCLYCCNHNMSCRRFWKKAVNSFSRLVYYKWYVIILLFILWIAFANLAVWVYYSSDQKYTLRLHGPILKLPSKIPHEIFSKINSILAACLVFIAAYFIAHSYSMKAKIKRLERKAIQYQKILQRRRVRVENLEREKDCISKMNVDSENVFNDMIRGQEFFGTYLDAMKASLDQTDDSVQLLLRSSNDRNLTPQPFHRGDTTEDEEKTNEEPSHRNMDHKIRTYSADGLRSVLLAAHHPSFHKNSLSTKTANNAKSDANVADNPRFEIEKHLRVLMQIYQGFKKYNTNMQYFIFVKLCKDLEHINEDILSRTSHHKNLRNTNLLSADYYHSHHTNSNTTNTTNHTNNTRYTTLNDDNNNNANTNHNRRGQPRNNDGYTADEGEMMLATQFSNLLSKIPKSYRLQFIQLQNDENHGDVSYYRIYELMQNIMQHGMKDNGVNADTEGADEDNGHGRDEEEDERRSRPQNAEDVEDKNDEEKDHSRSRIHSGSEASPHLSRDSNNNNVGEISQTLMDKYGHSTDGAQNTQVSDTLMSIRSLKSNTAKSKTVKSEAADINDVFGGYLQYGEDNAK